MAFVFNPATGKFEQRKSNQTGAGQQGPVAPKSKGGLDPKTQAKRGVDGKIVGAGPPGPDGSLPPLNTPAVPAGPAHNGKMPGPATPGISSTLDVINADIARVADDAAKYKEVNGEDPPASWYQVQLLPIQTAIDERERLITAQTERAEKDAAARAAAARSAAARAAAEQERQRAVAAGAKAVADLKGEAARIKKDAIERIAGLYDPMQTRSQDELTASLTNVANAFANAEQQVRAAGTMFSESFQPGTAYQDVPVATYNVADNPLLAALQQQGAGTGEVEAATGLARQSAEQASALEKWAASQLGTSQKNYEEAMRRASSGGVTAALQNMAARRPQVEEGVRSDYRKILDELARERATAETEAGSAYDEAIATANQMAAKTLAEYGKVNEGKKKKQQPVAPNTSNKKGTTTPSSGSTSKPKPVGTRLKDIKNQKG
jgi:hypothetical protein